MKIINCCLALPGLAMFALLLVIFWNIAPILDWFLAGLTLYLIHVKWKHGDFRTKPPTPQD